MLLLYAKKTFFIYFYSRSKVKLCKIPNFSWSLFFLKVQAGWHAALPIKILQKKNHMASFDIKYVYFVFTDDILVEIAIFISDSFTATFLFLLKTATDAICHVAGHYFLPF